MFLTKSLSIIGASEGIDLVGEASTRGRILRIPQMKETRVTQGETTNPKRRNRALLNLARRNRSAIRRRGCASPGRVSPLGLLASELTSTLVMLRTNDILLRRPRKGQRFPWMIFLNWKAYGVTLTMTQAVIA